MGPTEADYGNNVSGATADAGPRSSLFLDPVRRAAQTRSLLRRSRGSWSVVSWPRPSSLIDRSPCLSAPLSSRLSLCIRWSNEPPSFVPSYFWFCARVPEFCLVVRSQASTQRRGIVDGRTMPRRSEETNISKRVVPLCSRRVSETISPDTADFANLCNSHEHRAQRSDFSSRAFVLRTTFHRSM